MRQTVSQSVRQTDSRSVKTFYLWFSFVKTKWNSSSSSFYFTKKYGFLSLQYTVSIFVFAWSAVGFENLLPFTYFREHLYPRSSVVCWWKNRSSVISDYSLSTSWFTFLNFTPYSDVNMTSFRTMIFLCSYGLLAYKLASCLFDNRFIDSLIDWSIVCFFLDTWSAF